MSNYYEIDFLKVGETRSGDAITIRYQIDGVITIQVVDAGFKDTGPEMVNHINTYYDKPEKIDFVVVTHPHDDHVGGFEELFDNFEIGELWMLRPWLYADELIGRFSRYTSAENLAKELKKCYPNIAKLEKLANDHGIEIKEPLQGKKIGEFTVFAPSKAKYLDYVVESEKTPKEAKASVGELFIRVTRAVVSFIKSEWGEERFPSDDTCAENNMSVVQYAELCETKILLTGDAGRAVLEEVIEYAPDAGLNLPGIDRIQIPHHGSRHNVSTEILDKLLGEVLEEQPESGQEIFSAIVSAAEDDEEHPRKTVTRAFIHRGGKVVETKGSTIQAHRNAPAREGWSAVTPVEYPTEQEK